MEHNIVCNRFSFKTVGNDVITSVQSTDGSNLKLPGEVTFVQHGDGSSINIFFGPVYHGSIENSNQG